jgi:Putative adhesin
MKDNLLSPSKLTVLALALLALTTATRAEVEDKITKSFPLDPGGQLVVQADRGGIEVRTADRNSVDIEVTRQAGGSRTKAEQTLKDHVVSITQDGNKVEVRAEYKGEKTSGWFGNSPDLRVNYLITVPRKFDVNLKTAGGSVKVSELTGKVQAASSGGGLNFTKIEGPLSGHTSGGGITVAGCKGNADLRTSGGGLKLSEIEGDVDARTSGGSVHADKLTGKSVLKSSGGGIEVSEIKGQVEASTSGGGITASLLTQPTGDCTFKTSGGGIKVVLGEKLTVDVDARTSGGRVTSDLPVTTVTQGEPKKNELRGKINSGGPLIIAHTSGGGVRFEKK